ncbi:unnamed protein product [Schistocephalus solidus]|uniref:Serine/arginine repetitive matrix protein 2 n=1 Tax=Schistocephalus solidus TaxID=70667 RepID=A0A183SM26_SCHSO|nr:unnamed protein product [Schistocephalus solidus]
MWRWLSKFSGDRGPPERQQRSFTMPRHASESPSPSPSRDGVSQQKKKASTMDNAHQLEEGVSDAGTPLKQSRFAFLRPRRWRTLSFSRNASKPKEGKQGSAGPSSPVISTLSSPARQVSGQKAQSSERQAQQTIQHSMHGLSPVVSSPTSSSRASTLSDKDITPTTEEPKPLKGLEKRGAATAACTALPSEEEKTQQGASASKRRAKRPHSPTSPPPQQSPSASSRTTTDSSSSSSGRPSRRDAKSRTLTKPSFLHFAKQAPVDDPLAVSALLYSALISLIPLALFISALKRNRITIVRNLLFSRSETGVNL